MLCLERAKDFRTRLNCMRRINFIYDQMRINLYTCRFIVSWQIFKRNLTTMFHLTPLGIDICWEATEFSVSIDPIKNYQCTLRQRSSIAWDNSNLSGVTWDNPWQLLCSLGYVETCPFLDALPFISNLSKLSLKINNVRTASDMFEWF